MKYITYPLNHEATEFYLWKEQGQTICVTYLLKKNTLYKITYNIFTSLCPSHHAMSLTPPVSMTSLSLQSRCHLHRWVCNPGVNDNAKSDFRCDNPEIFACENISTKSKPHLKIQ